MNIKKGESQRLASAWQPKMSGSLVGSQNSAHTELYRETLLIQGRVSF